MIKVSVLYPNSVGSKFDVDYYCDKHIPLVKRLVGEALLDSSVDIGIAGGSPGEAAAYVAMGHLFFNSVEDFQQSFYPHADQISGDIPNYTDIVPAIQISEVRL